VEAAAFFWDGEKEMKEKNRNERPNGPYEKVKG
jgi:hypothetical protein